LGNRKNPKGENSKANVYMYRTGGDRRDYPALDFFEEETVK
jgi:hypothetical protein